MLNVIDLSREIALTRDGPVYNFTVKLLLWRKRYNLLAISRVSYCYFIVRINISFGIVSCDVLEKQENTSGCHQTLMRYLYRPNEYGNSTFKR